MARLARSAAAWSAAVLACTTAAAEDFDPGSVAPPVPQPETDIRFFYLRMPTSGQETITYTTGGKDQSAPQPGGRRIGLAFLGREPVGDNGGRYSFGVWTGFHQMETTESSVRREHWGLMADVEIGWAQRLKNAPWLDLEAGAFVGLGLASVVVNGSHDANGRPIQPSGTGHSTEYGLRAGLVATRGSWQFGFDGRWMRYQHEVSLSNRADAATGAASVSAKDRLEIRGFTFALMTGFRF